jgi:HD-GYP domain-containing protein (c-di-GMP phosphodiesterase class II)
MWRPQPDIFPQYKNTQLVERELLSIYRGNKPLAEFSHHDTLKELWNWIDQDPHQAFLLARIKIGPAMTPRHAINVMLMARAWAKHSHKFGDRLDSFSYAALFHDVLQFQLDGIPYESGFFSKDQMRLLQTHTKLDAEAAFLNEEARQWIAQHHEQPDGKGYPEGVTDVAMPSQILRVVDVYDGLTTPRQIRPRYSEPEAIKLMSRWAGHKYHAGLFKSFLKFVGTFPVGTMVRLQSGNLAITLPPEGEDLPVLVISNEEGDALASPHVETLNVLSIREEARAWQSPKLADAWRNLRPDWIAFPGL